MDPHSIDKQHKTGLYQQVLVSTHVWQRESERHKRATFSAKKRKLRSYASYSSLMRRALFYGLAMPYLCCIKTGPNGEVTRAERN